MRKTLGSRCISSRSAWFRASRYVSVATLVGEHVRGELGGVRVRALLRELHGRLHFPAHRGVELVDRRLVEHTLVLELERELRDGIALLLFLDFVLGAV